MYSPQKQMGRPKKRQRMEDEEDATIQNTSGGNFMHSTDRSSTTANDISVLTPGGSLAPWLFDFDTSANSYDNDSQPPSLTPDNSSNDSPPMLNLPPELINTGPRRNFLDSSTSLLLDPILTNQPAVSDGSNLGLPPSLVPSCACLSTMYLTLSSLQTLDPLQTPFPFGLHPLRSAMQTAADVLSCEECPQRFISAIQNTQLIGTLLMSIAERFGKVLDAITTEAERAEAAGERKTFRLADLNTSTSHLHTGGIGCAAAFHVDLSPAEWRALAKKVVRAEVQGAGAGNECCVCFDGVIGVMEKRQDLWHNRPYPADFPKDSRTGLPMGGRHIPQEEHMCLKSVKYARRLMEGFDWA